MLDEFIKKGKKKKGSGQNKADSDETVKIFPRKKREGKNGLRPDLKRKRARGGDVGMTPYDKKKKCGKRDSRNNSSTGKKEGGGRAAYKRKGYRKSTRTYRIWFKKKRGSSKPERADSGDTPKLSDQKKNVGGRSGHGWMDHPRRPSS